MRQHSHASSAISLIDTAQFRKLVQIDAERRPGDPEREWDDDLAKTDKLRRLDLTELEDEVDEDPGFDPYNSASAAT